MLPSILDDILDYSIVTVYRLSSTIIRQQVPGLNNGHETEYAILFFYVFLQSFAKILEHYLKINKSLSTLHIL